MLAGYGDNIDAINNFLNDFDNLKITDKKILSYPSFSASCSLYS